MSWIKQQQNLQHPQQQQRTPSVLGGNETPSNFLQQQWPSNQLPPNYQQQNYYQQPALQSHQFGGTAPPPISNNLAMQTTNQNQQHYQNQNNNWESPTLHSGNVANNNLQEQRINASLSGNQANQKMTANNLGNTNDGWGDWGEDWTDNQQQPKQQQSAQRQPQQQQQYFQAPPQQFQNNFVSIEDSFKTQPNDNWNWGIQESAKPPFASSQQYEQQSIPLSVPTSSANSINNNLNNNYVNQVTNEEKLESLSTFNNSTEVLATENNNFNQNLYSGNQIYHSMTKPVIRPTRQFASPAKESLPFGQTGESESTVDKSNEVIQNDSNFNYEMSDQAHGHKAPEMLYDNTNFGNKEDLSLSSQNIANHQNVLPPPITDEIFGASDLTALPPPPLLGEKTAANPFKRAGGLQRANVSMPITPNSSAVKLSQNTFLSTPPPPPVEFQSIGENSFQTQNSEILPPAVIENSETCSNDRNQYLQTSHLSEDGGYTNQERQNQESDNSFPPPGLSRLVLGQPETGLTSTNNNSTEILSGEIPPGLDRMVPGTELSSSTNLERQADGQDTIPLPRSAFAQQQTEIETNIDITSDRNLYLVPGESEHTTQQLLQQQQTLQQHQQPVQMQLHQQQRVVTGLDNFSMQNIEQRDVELDGENLEDVHQPNSNMNTEVDISSRNEPIEGANTADAVPAQNNETESSLTVETHFKDYSNPSTANDESDNHLRSRGAPRGDEKNKRGHSHQKDILNKKKERYETEETDSSGREENARDSKERMDKDRRRDKNREYRNEKYRDEKDKSRRDRYDRRYRYEADSKYETEESRYERRSKDERYDRNYDDYERRDDKNRKSYRRGDRDDRRTDRRRRDDRPENRHRDDDYYGRDKRSNHHRSDRYRSSDYDDDYRKNSSRNARDSDLEKDSKRKMNDKDQQRYANMYGYPGYGYDPYAYYQQQQQYYEQLRRTNPQAYAEWYRKYYSAHQPTTGQNELLLTNTDGRESVHSGRSSANNDKDRYSNHQQYTSHQYHQPQNDYHHHFMQQTNVSSTPNCSMINEQNSRYFCYQQPYAHNLSGGNSTGNLSQHGVGTGSIHNNNGYLPSARSYSYARSEYSESRPDNLSLNLIDTGKSSINQEEEPQRLTPRKFTNDHSFVSISAGILVCVKPKYSQNGVTNVVKILRMGNNDSTKRLFHSFPGPLVRGQTHKKTVIEFCEEQIRLGPATFNNAILRSRQNSMSSLSSTNNVHVASFTLMWNLLILLLRQNGMVIGTDIAELLMKNKTQFPHDLASKSSSLRSTENSNKKDLEQNEDKSPEEENESDDSIDDGSNSSNFLSEEEITEKFRNHLIYGNVTEALDWATDNNLWGHALFLASKVDKRSHANVMMKFANKLTLNDPLQTLYQLMSGRTPSSVTSCQDEKWGDWRPHLAMILSNTSQKPELDRKAITTLGDTLSQRDDLFAAQFCYLMAQVGFGKYPDVTSQQDQLGSQNSVRLILLGSSHNKPFREFAFNEAIMMTEIYEYACSLNDDKFSIVEFQPYKYLLATRMLDYGHQLKTLMYMEQIASHIQRDSSKYEAGFIERVYNLADQLKYYDPVLEKTMDDQNDENQGVVEDQKWLQDLNNILLEKGNLNPYLSANYNYGEPSLPVSYEQNFDQNRAEIDQQFAQINQQFQQLSVQYDNFDPMQQNQNVVENNNQIPNQQDPPIQPQFYNPNEVQQQLTSEPNSINYANYGEQSGTFPQQNSGFELGHQHLQQQQPQQHSNQSDNSYPNSGNYEYWDQSQQQQQQQQQYQEDISRPTISLPNAKKSYYDDDASNKNSGESKQMANAEQKQPQKSNEKNQNKSSQNNLAQNSGWFGGIWNKLSLKPKNQMILPDDKNPTIVWDPDTKRWVNTDGDEADQNSFKPPPKMSDIMGSSNALNQGMPPALQSPPPPEQNVQQNYSMNQSNISNSPKPMPLPNYNPTPVVNSLPGNVANPTIGATETHKTPSLQSNMFKMQRNKTLKKSYVDVFNPSGAPSKPVEPVLAPSIPAAVPQSGFLIPSSGDNNQSSQQGAPQFYNPNQFSGYQQ